METLLTGIDYEELPDTYVIFICDFDPFGKGKYRYTKRTICKEVPELEMDDGAHTIFLSTKGTNEDEVPEELVNFLKFVGAKPSESENDFEDAFIKRLQQSVKNVKVSREMGARYMTFQELLKDERKAGRREQLVTQVKRKLEKGLPVGDIAEALEEDVRVIEEIIKELNGTN